MKKSGAGELFSTLKGYVNQLSDGERTPAEVASAVNDWARESAESIKARVHEEVEASVLKMGFIKREEFDALAIRVAKLEVLLAQKKEKPAKRKISLSKSAGEKEVKSKPEKSQSKKVKGEKK